MDKCSSFVSIGKVVLLEMISFCLVNAIISFCSMIVVRKLNSLNESVIISVGQSGFKLKTRLSRSQPITSPTTKSASIDLSNEVPGTEKILRECTLKSTEKCKIDHHLPYPYTRFNYTQTFAFPIVDFERFLSKNVSLEDQLAVGNDVVNAFRQFGFLYLKNHGIPAQQLKNVFLEVGL